MNDQTLERLMIDQSLGALPDDVNQLLSAFVASQPDGLRHLDQWNQMAAIAQQALGPSQEETAPPFPIGVLRRRQIWHAGRLSLAAAAMLAVGIGIGQLTPRESASRQPVEVTMARPTSPPIAAGVESFWSSRRLLALAADQPRQLPSNLQWTSPIAQPQIGGLR